jgi:hypothetical protein
MSRQKYRAFQCDCWANAETHIDRFQGNGLLVEMFESIASREIGERLRAMQEGKLKSGQTILK